MKLKTTIIYQEPYLPTTRSRKLRYREAKEIVYTEINEIEQELAPIAFLCDNLECRLFNGQLYSKVRDIICCNGDTTHLKDDILSQLIYKFEKCSNFYGFNSEDSREKMIQKTIDYASFYLIIDNVVWGKVGEPRYEIITFGLGGNHGSTSLHIATGYNSNISNDAYFNAFDRDKAIQKALSVAANRCDTESFEKIRNCPEIKVLIPSAVKCNPELQHYK